MKVGELFYNIAISGVNHSLEGNGGLECINVSLIFNLMKILVYSFLAAFN